MRCCTVTHTHDSCAYITHTSRAHRIKEGKPQKIIAERAGCSQSAVSKYIHRKLTGRKKCGRKRCTSNRDDHSLGKIVRKSRFKNLGEPPYTDVFRKWAAAAVTFLEPSHSRTRNNVRSISPGLRRKRTGLLLSGPQSSFQMKVNFAFHLEINVSESGGKVERHRIQAAWSPVWSFRSQWWFGVPCHLLVLVHYALSSPKSMQPSTRRFWSTLCFHLLTSFMEMLISFCSRT